jgi:hypothetical protein
VVYKKTEVGKLVELVDYYQEFNSTFNKIIECSELRTQTYYNEFINEFEVESQSAYILIKKNYKEIIAEGIVNLLSSDEDIMVMIDYLIEVSRFIDDFEVSNKVFSIYDEKGYQYETKINLEKKQSQFVCSSCGTELNADYNAAKNIANSTKYVEKKSQCQYWINKKQEKEDKKSETVCSDNVS